MYRSNVKNSHIRKFHIGAIRDGQDSSSKVEETVKSIKEEKDKQKSGTVILTNVANPSEEALKTKTLWKKIRAELTHYYHGFRLLALDMKVSAKLIWRILQGYDLSRREHRLVTLCT